MSNRNYVYPQKTLDARRSKFKMPHQIKTSFLHGDCVPFQILEVLPGDTFKLNLATLIRMSTPIAPIMDNITMHFAAYFVPNRLVYENWEQVCGCNKTGAWTQSPNAYTVPMISLTTVPSGTDLSRCIGQYMGARMVGGYSSGYEISCLPARAYLLVWDEFYRNQNVTAPHDIDHSATNRITVSGTYGYYSNPLPLGKYSDYFTKCLPEPQKHDPIQIIPEDLKFDVGSIYTLSSGSFKLGNKGSGGAVLGAGNHPIFATGDGSSFAGDMGAFQSASTGVSSYTLNSTNAYASVEAAWNNINALRFAFQLQKFYEKDARYGSRYFEMLNGHFGVTNPDLVLNRPQFLGEINFRINVDQVLSTSGYSATSSTTVGAPGANSVTGHKGSLFTGSFTEHGYIIIVGGARHDHTYGKGVQRFWTRKDRLDFYDPVFANIGEQPVMESELYLVAPQGGSSTYTDSVFGYQEAWAEYRFVPDRTSGILSPWLTGSLDFWTLTDNFASAPLLNDTFIYENRDSISRALVTGSAGPDYIADIYFDLVCTREMPLFSIPGLADHH